jgi:citrate synthase
VRAIDRALALLADHELASSTLAVRIAASTWADPYACVLTGLGVLSGPLHGGASRAHHQLLLDCEARGVEVVVGEHLRAGEKLPGFGHKIYRGDDPRVAPLRELLPGFGSPARREIVDQLLALTSGRLTVRPNVDSALAALSFVAGLPPDTGELMFSVARIAGWLAHVIEEYGEAPVRFRAVGRYVGD